MPAAIPFLIAAAVKVVTAIVITVIVKAITPKPKTPTKQAQSQQVQLGEGPREALFGRGGTMGSLLDAFFWGGTYGTDWNGFAYDVADHECDALEGFYVNDVWVAFTGNGAVTGYNGSLEIYWMPGTETQAFPAVMAHSNLIGNLAGVSTIIVAYKDDSKTWTAGRPTFVFQLRGKKCYDPRKDSTVAGGSGTHRWADPTTWEWTDNAYICRYNWARGVYACDRVDQPDQLLIGRGLSADEAPPERVAAWANLCDEDVPLKAGGTEKRYRVGCVIQSTTPYLEVEGEFAKAMAGEIIQPEGGVEIEPGHAKSYVFDITDADLVAGVSVVFDEFPGANDRINTIIPLYTEPTQKWAPDHAAPVRRVLGDITDDGQPKEDQLRLSYVNSNTQAQRCGEIERRHKRHFRTARITLGPRWSWIEEGDWGQWTSARWTKGDAVIWIVEKYSVGKDRRITLSLREIDAADYDWVAATDEITPGANPQTASTPPTALTLASPSFSALSLNGQPGVKVTWTASSDPALIGALLQVRVKTTTNAVTCASVDDTSLGQMAGINGVYPSTLMQAQLVPVARDPNRPVTPSGWVDVTTGALTAGVAGSVPWTGVTDPSGTKPTDNADVTGTHVAAGITNQQPWATAVVSVQSTAPSSPATGAIWIDTSATPNLWKRWSGSAWVATTPTNTSQLTDGANLGGTAAWTGVTFRPTELTDGRVSAGLNSSGDLNRDIASARANTSNLLRYTSGGLFSGELTADQTSAHVAASVTGQQAWATAVVSVQSTAPSSPATGAIWIDTSATPNLWKRWSGAAWVATTPTNTNQLTDGANLGGTAAWTGVTSRPTELTDGRITAGLTSAGDLNRDIASARANTSNLLRYTSGGLFSGELTADQTSAHVAASVSGQQAWATAVVSVQSTAPSSPATGAIWIDTSTTPNLWKRWSGSAWVATTPTNTNQLTDGSNLGGTAAWGGVTSRPTELTDGRITAGLTSAGDLARDIASARANTSNLLRYTSGGLFSGELTADQTGAHVAASVSGQQAWATAVVSVQSTAPSSPATGAIWIDTSATPNLWKRYNGSVWVATTPTNTNQLTDGSNLGGTAAWGGVTSRPANLSSLAGTEGILNGSITSADANASNLLRKTSGGLFTGELAADQTSAHVAASVSGQQAWATALVSVQSSAPSSPATGAIWIDTTTALHVWKRWSGSAWVGPTVANGGIDTAQLATSAVGTQQAANNAFTGNGSVSTIGAVPSTGFICATSVFTDPSSHTTNANPNGGAVYTETSGGNTYYFNWIKVSEIVVTVVDKDGTGAGGDVDITFETGVLVNAGIIGTLYLTADFSTSFLSSPPSSGYLKKRNVRVEPSSGATWEITTGMAYTIKGLTPGNHTLTMWYWMRGPAANRSSCSFQDPQFTPDLRNK